MNLYPLIPPDLRGMRDPVDSGWARSLYRGPRTVQQVLEDARREMEEADAAAGDPLAVLAVRRYRRRAFRHRLLRRRGG